MSALEAAASAAAESPEAAALTSSVSQKQQQLDKLESRLNSIKDRLFADFRWACWQLLCAVLDLFVLQSNTASGLHSAGCASGIAKPSPSWLLQMS